MRIALIGRYHVSYPYTEHRLDYALNKAIASRCEELHLLMLGAGATPALWREGNLVVHYAPQLVKRLHVPAFILWARNKLLELHAQGTINVVSGSDLWGCLAGILARPRMHAKVLAQLQGEFFPPNRYSCSAAYRPLLHWVAAFVCRNADRVRCLYPSAGDQLQNQLHISATRIAIVPSRCNTELFDPSRFAPGSDRGRRLLYVGNLIPGKGVAFLLEALSKLTSEFSDLSLVIVGSGPEAERLRQQADRLGVRERVQFAGRMSHEELPSMLAQADLFVFPSLSEATPRAVLEAMAMALPVIASRTGGIPYLVEDGTTGLLVEPADATSLATAVRRALHDPGWMRRAGAAGRQRVRECFTQERHIAAMLALYANLADGDPSGAPS